ncbi:MAG: hypothetical protein JNL38_20770 [Myxococcales bacterium]|nr:hypothetical protein [Myxococcales bacterium]
MGERYHHARTCDPELVAALADAAGESVRRRDPAPLEAFVDAHRGRQRRIHGHRVPIDLAAIEAARHELALSAAAAPPRARAVLEATAPSALPRGPVSKTALDTLVARLARLGRLVSIQAPEIILGDELTYATAALEALLPGDLDERLERAGLVDEWEGNLLDRGLALSAVPGWDGEIGLLEHFVGWDAFVAGAPLVPMPGAPEDPPDELLGRCLERFGEYSVDRAHELHLEDWMQFASSFGYYVPPVWGHGDELRAAAAQLERIAAEPDEDSGEPPDADTRDALGRYRAELLRAADAGHAVVEWVVKH